MQGSLTIRQARLVLPNRVVTGDLVVDDGVISAIGPHVDTAAGPEVDGRGLTVLPGLVDIAVRLREPGYTSAETIHTGTRAAAAGGVTSLLALPDRWNPVDTQSAIDAHLHLVGGTALTHFGVVASATRHNLEQLSQLKGIAAVKVHLADHTDALPHDPDLLGRLFASCRHRLLIQAEDALRLKDRGLMYQDAQSAVIHPTLRDVETAVEGLQAVLQLAATHGTRTHILQVSSAEELDCVSRAGAHVTASVALPHLFLDADDYPRLGNRMVTNPPVRKVSHQRALWRGLHDEVLHCITSDHAPHPAEAKDLPYLEAPAGLPGVEWMLPLLLDAVNQGRLHLCQVARLCAQQPADRFGLPRKGKLEVGYDGDLVLVDMNRESVISDADTRSRAGWSPYAGRTLQGAVHATVLMGNPVFQEGQIRGSVRGHRLQCAH